MDPNYTSNFPFGTPSTHEPYEDPYTTFDYPTPTSLGLNIPDHDPHLLDRLLSLSHNSATKKVRKPLPTSEPPIDPTLFKAPPIQNSNLTPKYSTSTYATTSGLIDPLLFQTLPIQQNPTSTHITTSETAIDPSLFQNLPIQNSNRTTNVLQGLPQTYLAHQKTNPVLQNLNLNAKYQHLDLTPTSARTQGKGLQQTYPPPQEIDPSLFQPTPIQDSHSVSNLDPSLSKASQNQNVNTTYEYPYPHHEGFQPYQPKPPQEIDPSLFQPTPIQDSHSVSNLDPSLSKASQNQNVNTTYEYPYPHHEGFQPYQPKPLQEMDLTLSQTTPVQSLTPAPTSKLNPKRGLIQLNTFLPQQAYNSIGNTVSCTSRPHFLVIYGSPNETTKCFFPDTGPGSQSWCGDCRDASSLIIERFGQWEDVVYVVDVGDKAEWRNPSNIWRGLPFQITNLPTLIRIEPWNDPIATTKGIHCKGYGHKILVESDILNPAQLDAFIIDGSYGSALRSAVSGYTSQVDPAPFPTPPSIETQLPIQAPSLSLEQSDALTYDCNYGGAVRRPAKGYTTQLDPVPFSPPEAPKQPAFPIETPLSSVIQQEFPELAQTPTAAPVQQEGGRGSVRTPFGPIGMERWVMHLFVEHPDTGG